MTTSCTLKLVALAAMLGLASCAASDAASRQGPSPISGPQRLYLRAPAPEVVPLAQPHLRPLDPPEEERDARNGSPP